jgi:hypothetical protein
MTTMTRTTMVDDVDVAVVATRPRSVVSWSSILAGSLVALATLVLLSVAALAAGLELADIRGNEDPRFGATVASVLTGLFIIIAFGAGGLTAVWAAGHTEPGPAILHGFLVWALALMLMLGLVALGLGGGFGELGRFFGANFDPADVEAFETAGWGAALGLALGAGSAILGGLLATREEISRVW